MQDSTFVELFEKQYPRVVAYARRRLGSMPDAEDCAAEVFRLAWEQDSLPSVGWLFVTARNIVYAVNRSHQRLSELCSRMAVEEGCGITPEDIGVLEAMDSLSETDREILMAYYWDDLSGAQCAKLMGCSSAAVWVRLHRARQSLKAILEKQGIRGPVRPVPEIHEHEAVRPTPSEPQPLSSCEPQPLSSCRRQDLIPPTWQGETS